MLALPRVNLPLSSLPAPVDAPVTGKARSMPPDCMHRMSHESITVSDQSDQPEIVIYSSAVCAYCVAAKNFLGSRGLRYREVRVDLDPEERARLVERTRRTTVPQIFIGDTHVGGYDDMMALHRSGGLEPLLAGSAAH